METPQERIEKELTEAERVIKVLLEKMKNDYKENEERMTKAKEALKLNLQDYKFALAKQVDLAIAIAEQETILEELIKKRNPSKRYQRR